MQQRRREVGGEDEGITWEVSMIYTPTRTACRLVISPRFDRSIQYRLCKARFNQIYRGLEHFRLKESCCRRLVVCVVHCCHEVAMRKTVVQS